MLQEAETLRIPLAEGCCAQCCFHYKPLHLVACMGSEWLGAVNRTTGAHVFYGMKAQQSVAPLSLLAGTVQLACQSQQSHQGPSRYIGSFSPHQSRQPAHPVGTPHFTCNP